MTTPRTAQPPTRTYYQMGVDSLNYLKDFSSSTLTSLNNHKTVVLSSLLSTLIFYKSPQAQDLASNLFANRFVSKLPQKCTQNKIVQAGSIGTIGAVLGRGLETAKTLIWPNVQPPAGEVSLTITDQAAERDSSLLSVTSAPSSIREELSKLQVDNPEVSAIVEESPSPSTQETITLEIEPATQVATSVEDEPEASTTAPEAQAEATTLEGTKALPSEEEVSEKVKKTIGRKISDAVYFGENDGTLKKIIKLVPLIVFTILSFTFSLLQKTLSTITAIFKKTTPNKSQVINSQNNENLNKA